MASLYRWHNLFRLAIRDSDPTVLLANLDGAQHETCYGSNVLHFAAINYDNERVCLFLLGHCSSLSSKSNCFGELPIHWACKNGTPLIVQSLLDSYENSLNMQDGTGDTPMHYAAEYNRGDIMKVLLSAGGDQTIPNYDGDTPLDIAVQNESVTAICLLSDDP